MTGLTTSMLWVSSAEDKFKKKKELRIEIRDRNRMHQHQGKCSGKCRYNEPSGPGVLPSLSSIQSITAKDNKTDIRQIDYCCALPCEVKHQVYVKRQTRICNTWPGFPHYLSFTVHFFLHKLIVSSKFFIDNNRFELFLSSHFLFWEILNLNLMFVVCRKREA